MRENSTYFYLLFSGELPGHFIKNGIKLNLQQCDDFSYNETLAHQVTTVTKILDDRNKYVYFPFHKFIQRLWCSKSFEQQYGPFKSIDDLRRCPIALQRGETDKAPIKTHDLIGYRGIFDKLPLTNHDPYLLNIRGIRIIDLLAEKGYAIVSGSFETTKLLGLKLINILPEVTGDPFPVYIKARKETYYTYSPIQKLIDFAFWCRDEQLKSIKTNPSFPYTQNPLQDF